ncbi:DUF2959 family protein [Pseudomonas sp. CCI3.2]|uniref:DUF2959 family protein n=1 Tax=unclassified Pseudomonas TaxID=196821 RepID=UPI002AC9929E|nr:MULTISPECIES: DUF2959 family protein [unclassified Pseudomonas]MEB0075987.1 DUF2959 family protein [Pseudomonas sp. MH10out]MEB0093697.1 DUF2959 family protein [Pseudomonas sp. CCI4.2]MEB0101432.1 DUF2959 family protein [Pseudomonas sp. CCI3.2]MEB0130966.1 DUF2959 family protein [Pseudomonas sp. CCI2.4]MEB0157944.1 DUF2959 family protein [Pseudomonas sp. AH2 (2023)]
MRHLALAFLALFALSGCQSAYFAAMDEAGISKRQMLAGRIEDARDAQKDTSKHLSSALENYRRVVHFDGGDLEKRYDALNDDYQASVKSANAIHQRIASVENVADALFDEWNDELGQYTRQDLRAASAKELDRTHAEYRTLLATMKTAESRIPPVLSVLHDQVLFLKHNLNAQAIGALKDESGHVQNSVYDLLKDMQRSIDGSDAFVRRLQNSATP